MVASGSLLLVTGLDLLRFLASEPANEVMFSEWMPGHVHNQEFKCICVCVCVCVSEWPMACGQQNQPSAWFGQGALL